jgi:hypothetical protein
MSKQASKATVMAAVRLIVKANAERLNGWATLYAATATAVGMDGVSTNSLANEASTEGSPWQRRWGKVSNETLRSYVTAAGIIDGLPETVLQSTVVTSGDLHKKQATAKANGVTSAQVTAWATKAGKDARAAKDDEAAIKVLREAVEDMKKKITAKQESKKQSESGGSESTEQSETIDAEVTSAVDAAKQTPADLINAGAGPVGAAIKAMQSGFTAEDEAALRMLAGMVTAELRRISAIAA